MQRHGYADGTPNLTQVREAARSRGPTEETDTETAIEAFAVMCWN